MKRNSKDHQLALNHFLKYWAKFTIIQPYHAEWLSKYAKYASYKRGSCIYDFSWEEEKIIYVSQGILGRVNYYLDPKILKDKRSILSIGLPHMALMTTYHLYSRNQAKSNITALRKSHVLAISYNRIKNFMRDDRSLDSIVGAWMNKKKHQLARLRELNSCLDPQQSYLKFRKNMPELVASLSQVEQQDLLGISRSSIRRAIYFDLTGKKIR